MRKGLFIKYILSLLLVVSIGFMQYAIVTDNSPDIAATRRHTFQKSQDTRNYLSDLNEDDDEDAVSIKYFTQQFYHCDLFSPLQLIITADSSELSPRTIAAALVPLRHPIYQQVNSYRI